MILMVLLRNKWKWFLKGRKTEVGRPKKVQTGILPYLLGNI